MSIFHSVHLSQSQTQNKKLSSSKYSSTKNQKYFMVSILPFSSAQTKSPKKKDSRLNTGINYFSPMLSSGPRHQLRRGMNE